MLINYFKCRFGNADGFDVNMNRRNKEGKHPYMFGCSSPSNPTRKRNSEGEMVGVCDKENHDVGKTAECPWAKPLKFTTLKNGMRI